VPREATGEKEGSGHDRRRPSESVVVDIGGTIGALVVNTAQALDGAEIEIRPAGSTTRAHTIVRAREIPGGGVVYAGVFIATCGIYPAFPGNITWMSNNLAGSYKRAAGMAFHIGMGNLGGAMASNFYRGVDAPKFLLGHGLELMFCVIGLIAVVVLRLNYMRINKKRDSMHDDGSEYTDQQLSEMGDRAPTFRYQL